MKIELHILQNFAPANLNRSDTGSPKDCEFGGVRRARISSQCFKRAMREDFKKQPFFANGNGEKLAVRTKRLVEEVAKRIVAPEATDEEKTQARRVVEIGLNAMKLSVKDNDKTQYLIYLGKEKINRLAELCRQHFDALAAIAGQAGGGAEGAPKKSAKAQKTALKDAVPSELQKAFAEVLAGDTAVDLAMFGRMLADVQSRNIDAAAQVAHAISTNKVSMEFDFYTAVDDLKPEDNEGADMLGTIEFNSACFYRYLNLDVDALRENLKDDELTLEAVAAFVRAAINAVPTGKQNSMAAQQKPSFVLAVARENNLCSLANAFVKPASATFPNRTGDLISNSITKLDEHYGEMTAMYGEADVTAKHYVMQSGDDLSSMTGARVKTVDELVARVREIAAGGAGEIQ